MPYLNLALSFFKIGLLGFGGGYAMLPMIQKEVARFGISGTEFIDLLAISQMTPGPIGINASTYTGYKVAGFWGAAVATFSNVLPTFLLALIAAQLFYRFRKNHNVEAFFKGLRPLVIGLIAASVVLMAKDIRLGSNYKGILILLFVFIAGYRFKANPVLLIILAGITGALIY
jgi:chromate transporter